MWVNPPITHSHNSSKIQHMGFSLNDFWLHLFPFRDKSTARETEWAKLSERSERRQANEAKRSWVSGTNEGDRNWVSGANEGKRTKVSETEWAERTKVSETEWAERTKASEQRSASEWSEVKKLTEIIGTSLSRNREINQEKMMGLKLSQKASSYHYCILNDCLYFNMTIIEIYSHMNFNFLSQNNFIYMIVL